MYTLLAAPEEQILRVFWQKGGSKKGSKRGGKERICLFMIGSDFNEIDIDKMDAKKASNWVPGG